MTAIAARRKRRLTAAVITSVLSAITLPGGLVLGANMLLNDSGGKNVASEDLVRIPTTPVHLVTVVNDANVVASAALFAIAPGGAGGTIVSFPVGAQADTADDAAPRRIADSYVTGGLDAFRVDVEDLLNITVDSASVHTRSEWAQVLSVVGTQAISLSQPVVDTGLDGVETIVIDASVAEATPDQMAAALSALRAGYDEVSRFETHKSVWTAISSAGAGAASQEDDAVSDEGAGADTTTSTIDEELPPLATVQEYLAALLRGRVDVWQLAGTRLTDAQRNPAGLDMYGIDGGEVLMVMASVAPSAMRLVSDQLTVMVDVPFNNSLYAREAVTRLAYAGSNVVLVRHVTEAPAERTVAYVNDSIAAAEVANYAGLIGPVETVETLDRIDGVAVRLVLGNDFAAFLGADGVTTTTVAE